MITIRCRLKKFKINISELKKVIQKMLDKADRSDYDIGVWLTTNKTIRRYNKLYRKKDAATDILSFPANVENDLGDIIISLEYAKPERLKILFSHGIAHLLGYDHETEKDYKAMQKIESKLLK